MIISKHNSYSGMEDAYAKHKFNILWMNACKITRNWIYVVIMFLYVTKQKTGENRANQKNCMFSFKYTSLNVVRFNSMLKC